MTLPVSFNEPTSLLQRVTEDMVRPFAIHFPNIKQMLWHGQQDHVAGAE